MSEKTTDTDSTGTTTSGSIEVAFTDDHPNEYYEDYEVVSDGWLKLIGYDEPGHPEEGICELVPSRRVERLWFYEE